MRLYWYFRFVYSFSYLASNFANLYVDAVLLLTTGLIGFPGLFYLNLCLEKGWFGSFLREVFCFVFGGDQFAVFCVCGYVLLLLVCGVCLEFMKA
jgi:hypothetical protein